MTGEVRIDKYLWAIRVYKTRSEAAEACKGNKVKVNGFEVKPSRTVKEGDVLTVRKGAVCYTYSILRLVENRQSAKTVPEYAENRTPQTELDKMKAPAETFFFKRDRGSGRPTKKDRRQIDSLWNDMEPDISDEDPDNI
ncbi:MAG: RNA-binding S4 domain-containing protein [Bacteroidales bacterium]|jgi:ribosome-associated heat shock protein Hsp15|nr:RNA-binding S4 domain-containing protein [Bacteroidales bacterium]MCI1785144.1 RNA-binding S4 domain-containing protein [Bacteroidales bacterium]